MRITARHLSGIGAVLLLGMTAPSVVLAQTVRVRWDIIHLVFRAPAPNEVFEGGVADAKTTDGETLRLTGTGEFLARDGRRVGSGLATGGGSWQVISPTGVLLASGTYRATELVSWEFANLQTPGAVNDHIGPNASNGNAVLLVEYSDGSQGVLLVLCNGPGAPAGITEGVAATKGYKTYDRVQLPAAGVDLNRTIFHLLR
jgi:hypothetical protein